MSERARGGDHATPASATLVPSAPLSITIASWNINSVRLRMPIVKRFTELARPDVLCLQETKVRDEDFPFSDLRDLGYDHIEISGQKGYHGVAILSRHPLTDVTRGPFCREGHSRHISARVAVGAGVTVHNFYVPAGGDEPNPAINPKFDHKLHFLDRMIKGPERRHLLPERAVVVGDLNIAPLETDVWSHKALLKVVSHTPVEVEAFGRAQAAGGWVDAMRELVPAADRLYTWWSYRSPDWAAADKGRRLDHVWLSPDLRQDLGAVTVFKEARGWDKPSDHVPVMAELRI